MTEWGNRRAVPSLEVAVEKASPGQGAGDGEEQREQ